MLIIYDPISISTDIIQYICVCVSIYKIQQYVYEYTHLIQMCEGALLALFLKVSRSSDNPVPMSN